MINTPQGKYLFRIAGICFLFFLVYRLIFILYFSTRPTLLSSVLYAIRFDLQVCAYFVTLPFIILLLASFFKVKKIAMAFIKFYVLITGIILPLVVLSDFFYFQYYSERLSTAIFNWASSPSMMFSVIVGHFPYVAGLFLSVLLSVILIKLWSVKNLSIQSVKFNFHSILMMVVCLILIFTGLRGSLFGPVLKPSDAYENENPRINLSLVNPLRSFMESLIMFKFNFFDKQQITKNYKVYFNSDSSKIRTGYSENPNIILILVESLSADMINEKIDGKMVMPFLNKQIDSGIYFENTISAGSHTFNGVYSTLTALPSLPGEHSLVINNSRSDLFTFPQFFKQNGYHTSIFTTHHKQWDNIYNFFKTRGIDTFIDKYNYPSSSIVSEMGVSDAAELDKARQYFHQTGQPFFSTLITISTHGPHFKLNPQLKFLTRFKSVSNNLFSYTDSCLEDFFYRSRHEAWYKNTIFIITGDHGFKFREIGQHPLMAYHHIPSFIFGAGVKKNKITGSIEQMDLLPTVIGMTNLRINNKDFLGRDALSDNNNYAVFCTSVGFGCIMNKSIVYLNKRGEEQAVDYTFGYKKPDEIFKDSMINYAKTAMQLSKKGMR